MERVSLEAALIKIVTDLFIVRMALYHDFAPQQEPLAKARVWSYPSPTPSFTQIKDYLCFYASSNTNSNTVGKWTCVGVENYL